MNRQWLSLLVVSLLCFLFSVPAEAQVLSGGSYSIDRSAIAAGGGSHTGGAYQVEGTSGQSAVQPSSAGGSYSVFGGLWQPQIPLTAADVYVSGKVVDRRGAGIGSAVITLWGSSLSGTKVVRSNSFGNFRFDRLPAGEFYVMTVEHRSLAFQQSVIALTATDSVTDLVFIADRR